MAMSSLHRIVVGVDFGTTYTGVAWASTSNPTELEIIKNWPTAGQLVGSQAPSEISYDHEDVHAFSWGYNISPRSRKIKWFKLELEIEQSVLALPNGLNTEDVIHDYLSAIVKHTLETLYRRYDRGVMQITTVEFVLTVPAIWSDAAKQKTEQAAIKAGMGNEHNLQLLSEPESAAVYVLKNLETLHSNIRVHDRVVVCDAGGGTVDLITYDIEQISPGLKVVECTPGTGDFCGSTFIDKEFETLFKDRMGAHYHNVSEINRQQTVKNFEIVKLAFRNDPNQQLFYVNVPTIGTLEIARVYGGNLEITQEEMRRLFDPIIEKIITLLDTQVTMATRDSHQVNSILLVGGFGESEYLFQRVRVWASSKSIQVIQPREAATAIVRGAVLKGLEATITSEKAHVIRRARRSYGVPVNQPFIAGKHLEKDAFLDLQTGQKLARDQISWFIRKGQKMADDANFKHAFYRNFKQHTTWKDSIVSCEADNPPSRLEAPVDKLCTVVSDLTHLSLKKNFRRRWRLLKPYYTADYVIVLRVRNSNLTFELEYKGQIYGVAKVDFS